jgi:TRAP-type C4-dicarboxylate transport system substrate-binding protein
MAMKRSFLKALGVGAVAYAINPAGLYAQQVQQQTWRMAIPVPEKSWFGEMHRWWGNEVEKRSGGKITVTYFWSDSLVKWADALPGIQLGSPTWLGLAAHTFPQNSQITWF